MALIRRPLGAPRQCRSSVVSVTMVLPRKAVRSNARIPARNTSDRSGPLNRGRRARWRDRSGSHDAFPEFAFRQAISAQVSISTMFVGLSAGRVDVSETLAKTRDRREVLFTGRYSDVQGESDSRESRSSVFCGIFLVQRFESAIRILDMARKTTVRKPAAVSSPETNRPCFCRAWNGSLPKVASTFFGSLHDQSGFWTTE